MAVNPFANQHALCADLHTAVCFFLIWVLWGGGGGNATSLPCAWVGNHPGLPGPTVELISGG